jgi:HK97 family phage major capsid protein
MNEVQELGQELQAKRARLAEMFEKAGPDMKMSETEVNDLRTLNAEITDLGKKHQGKLEIQRIAEENRKELEALNAPQNRVGHGSGNVGNEVKDGSKLVQAKSLADVVLESKSYKDRADRGGRFALNLPDFDVKTLMATTAGWAAPNDRTNKVVMSAQNQINVQDIIPSGNTSLSVVKFMEETTFTNNAAAVAEGSAPTDSAFALTERSNEVEKIVGWLAVTDEQLEDVDGVRDYIMNRLMYQVRLTEQIEILTGDGTTPNLNGFATAVTAAQAKGADSTPDAIYKAMTVVRYTGRAEPSAAVFHPNDWQDIQLLTTADGIYIWGSPAAPMGQPFIWGLPVVLNTAQTENTALLGDFRNYSFLWRKKGLVIEVSDSHSTYFTEGKKVIKATERLALEVSRAAAFIEVTGI